MTRLNSFFVIPSFMFFEWGFTIPKSEYSDFIKFFRLNSGRQNADVQLVIGGKNHKAKIRMVRIRSRRFPKRDVVQVHYDRERVTLKALRYLFIYSYAATINKAKPQLKELLEFVHLGGSRFKIKPISKHKTDFDRMFAFLEDKNLFEFWKQSKLRSTRNFFLDFARSWLPVARLRDYRKRSNVIYLLYHSKKQQLYVGKANVLGERVKGGVGRVGLDKGWDKFMFFEIDPEYSAFINQIEAYTIRAFASLLENSVGSRPLAQKRIKLVNRQLSG